VDQLLLFNNSKRAMSMLLYFGSNFLQFEVKPPKLLFFHSYHRTGVEISEELAIVDRVKEGLSKLGLTTYGLTLGDAGTLHTQTHVVIVPKKEAFHPDNYRLKQFDRSFGISDKDFRYLISHCEVWVMEHVVEALDLIEHYKKKNLVYDQWPEPNRVYLIDAYAKSPLEVEQEAKRIEE
jgi:hypothetical protein